MVSNPQVVTLVKSELTGRKSFKMKLIFFFEKVETGFLLPSVVLNLLFKSTDPVCEIIFHHTSEKLPHASVETFK